MLCAHINDFYNRRGHRGVKKLSGGGRRQNSCTARRSAVGATSPDCDPDKNTDILTNLKMSKASPTPHIFKVVARKISFYFSLDVAHVMKCKQNITKIDCAHCTTGNMQENHLIKGKITLKYGSWTICLVMFVDGRASAPRWWDQNFLSFKYLKKLKWTFLMKEIDKLFHWPVNYL